MVLASSVNQGGSAAGKETGSVWLKEPSVQVEGTTLVSWVEFKVGGEGKVARARELVASARTLESYEAARAALTSALGRGF